MIKYFFALFFCLSFLLTKDNAQVAVGRVTYQVKVNLDKNLSRHQSMINAFPEISGKFESVAQELEFSLKFNDSISVFELENKLFSDNNVAALTLIHTGYFGRIRQQPTNYITENLEEDFGKFLVYRPYHKWELQSDSKQIGDYLCFKATTSETITNQEGKEFKRDFVAWYAPQLPYRFGPMGFGNLPGLIMELQGENCTFGVEKIEFQDKNAQKFKIPKLKNLKLISEEELEAMAAEDEKRWRN